MKKIILEVKQFRKLISILTEDENDDDEYYRISPTDYIRLLDFSGYHPKATYIKKFKGKPLYITGDLNLNGMDKLTTLGNVVYIDGNLNMTYTNISKIDDSIVKGYITDYGSTRDKIRIREEERKKIKLI